MNMVIQRPCTPVESLRQSCTEMKLIREGRLFPIRDWRTMFDELEKEIEEEDDSSDAK